MRRNILMTALTASFAFFTSCSSDDVEKHSSEIHLESTTILNASELLAQDPIIKNDTVRYVLKHLPDDFYFAPEFTLSAGTKIKPESGTERDFSQPQKYTLTSEDATQDKIYTVVFKANEKLAYTYSFENVQLINKEEETATQRSSPFQKFYEIDQEGRQNMIWASRNEEISFAMENFIEGEVVPEDYPTFQTSAGFSGNAAELVTKKTDSLAPKSASSLIAGKLYIGDFNHKVDSTQQDELIKLGKPYKFEHPPVAIKGYFKYKAGADFENNSGDTDLVEDRWDAYAVLFKKTESENYLPGDFNFNDDRIVSVAKLDDEQRIEAEEWTAFEMLFKRFDNQGFDPKADYRYTIVFSSSKEGDRFNGAEGSRLAVDEVQLITKEQ